MMRSGPPSSTFIRRAVEKHRALADTLKLVRYLEIVKLGLMRKNVREHVAQFWDVPLPIAQFVHEPPWVWSRLQLINPRLDLAQFHPVGIWSRHK